jgi:hypothetical protein
MTLGGDIHTTQKCGAYSSNPIDGGEPIMRSISHE